MWHEVGLAEEKVVEGSLPVRDAFLKGIAGVKRIRQRHLLQEAMLDE